MSRGTATFRQSDLDRAIRSVIKAGAIAYEVVIEGPRVIVRVGGVDKPKSEAIGSWDSVVTELERQ
jgi:hypothetical protein